MANNTNETGQFHKVITTKHVFIKDNQVFMRRASIDRFPEDNPMHEWFPTEFNWVS